MLKNIKLHVSEDEQVQEAFEKQLGQKIASLQKKNSDAFLRTIPGLLPLVNHTASQNISLFCNKFGEMNLVDYGQGRTLYGFHPRQEVIGHIEQWASSAFYTCIHGQQNSKEVKKENHKGAHQGAFDSGSVNHFQDLSSWRKQQSFSDLPQNPECLVVLGIGLGFHLQHLVENYQIKHLVVYEPETQYFQGCTKAIDWSVLFQVAKQKGTTIYLQIGKDGRDLVSDIGELAAADNIAGFYLYQHYQHPVFRALVQGLMHHNWQYLQDHGLSFQFDNSYLDYLPYWLPTTVTTSHQNVDPVTDELFKSNLAAFKKFFPSIHAEFATYQPQKWLPVRTGNGEINILHKSTLACWYSESPRQDCQIHYENFNQQPNKDGLALGYNGKKLRHYVHYQFVAKTEKLLRQVEEERGQLPTSIKSLIVFGCGSGYQLDMLIKNHEIANLFLCEPNRDYFYASLFAIPWHELLDKIDSKGYRVYLNIGDDGSHLIQDLMKQFYSIGPYLLNSTYFYQSYFNSNLNNAIAQLREQLQIIISLGEYFDHAWYGLHQTHEALFNSVPLMLKDPHKKLSYESKEVPVFLVGNGPSVDAAVSYLHEYRDQIILVSCGTVLKVLHKHGIKPDFHAEIEQNRTTYDWAIQVDDLDYLKDISLISCNGIHPDTCELYKDVYVAFKEGESSTVASLNILGEENYDTLKFAFPTVSNFALDLFTHLGFVNIYLVGVDLGFVDKSYHHSKYSSYYRKDGKELYDYSADNNTALIVPGNFRNTVNTKHEFKISRLMMEQVINSPECRSQIYNTSDGARIHGTFPLRIENLLVTSTREDRIQAIQSVKQKAFVKPDGTQFRKDLNERYSPEKCEKEIGHLLKLLDPPPRTVMDAEKLIEKQKYTLFGSYERGDNLLFYYLYGTSNYASAFLSKLLCGETNEEQLSERFNEGVTLWRDMLLRVKQLFVQSGSLYDNSGFNIQERELLLLRNKAVDKRVLIVTNSQGFVQAFRNCNKKTFLYQSDIAFCTPDSIPEKTFDIVLYNLLPEFKGGMTCSDLKSSIKSLKRGTRNTFICMYDEENRLYESLVTSGFDGLSIVSFVRDRNNAFLDRLWIDHQAHFAAFLARILFDKPGNLLYLSKHFLCREDSTERYIASPFLQLDDTFEVVEYWFYLVLRAKANDLNLVSTGGNRGCIFKGTDQKEFAQLRRYGHYTRDKYAESLGHVLPGNPELENDFEFQSGR